MCNRSRLSAAALSLLALTLASALGSAALAQGDKAKEPDRLALLRKLVALAQQATFTPRSAADALGARLGEASRPTEFRTDHTLGATPLIASGQVSSTKTWVAVQVNPAPALGLRMRDVEPLLLDFPHSAEVRTAHTEEGPRVFGKDHLFRVKAGMLVVVVPVAPTPGGYKQQLEKAYGDEWDTAAGKRPSDELIERFVLTNEPRPGLEKSPSLRAFRDQVRRAPPAR